MEEAKRVERPLIVRHEDPVPSVSAPDLSTIAADVALPTDSDSEDGTFEAPPSQPGGMVLFVSSQGQAPRPVEVVASATVGDLYATVGAGCTLTLGGEPLTDHSVALSDIGVSAESVLEAIPNYKWRLEELNELRPTFVVEYQYQEESPVTELAQWNWESTPIEESGMRSTCWVSLLEVTEAGDRVKEYPVMPLFPEVPCSRKDIVFNLPPGTVLQARLDGGSKMTIKGVYRRDNRVTGQQ